MAPSRAPNDPKRVATTMLSWHSLDLVSSTNLQTLWAGYGHICAITARATTDAAADHLDKLCGVRGGAAGTTYPLILKLISPPRVDASHEDEGHLRKMLSYEVEQYFYSQVAPQLDDDVAVARCLATTRDMKGRDGEEELRGLTATIMTDLRPKFPVAGEKRAVLNTKQVIGALEWLGKFHGRSWRWLPASLEEYVLPPLEESRRRKSPVGHAGTKLWLNGGYTYLATRRKEYAALAEDDSEWSLPMCKPPKGLLLSVAEMAATFLTPSGRPFETYIHGDVKSENLFTTVDGDKVAFFDFQYVGLGLGVCDLAKLFTCSVPMEMLADADEPLPEELTMRQGERQLLERYRDHLLQDDSSIKYDWDIFKRHWETALVDWCRFQASWGFWGNTEWLEARVRSILNDGGWRDWLQQSIKDRTG
ncbi:hypothetical protein ACO1O0_003680 [Amphichorda felina]